jgi:RNA polymerase sigma-70 factor (sigma-E family)
VGADYADLREFVTGRLGRLSRVAYLLAGRHADAEDLLQSALVKVAVRWQRVSRVGDPEAYLRKVLYHEHIRAWRRRRNEQLTGYVPEVATGQQEAAGVVRRAVLEQALGRLTPRQRAVLVLRFYEDLSEVDTAAVLGCSVGNVKSQTSRALDRLRQVAPELADLRDEMTEVQC